MHLQPVHVNRIYTGIAKQFIRHIKTSQPTDRLRTEMIRVTLLKVRNLVLVAVQSIVLFNQPSVTLFLYSFCLIICSVTGKPTPKEESPETYFDYTDPKWQQSEATNQFLKRPMQLSGYGGYDLSGPSQCADGLKQSPIDFKTFVVTNYTKFTFKKYNRIFPESLKNTGHSFELKIDSDDDDDEDLPSISGGGLTDRYSFVQLHFHWGKDLLGSEHSINGTKYAAELHILHYNTKYGSFKKALPHWDGLAVIGIFIEIQKRDNNAFRHLLEPFDNIIDPNKNISSKRLRFSVPLSDFLPDSTESFFRYNGSLTTNLCDEDVIWTVFDTPIAISPRQLAKFKQLKDEHGKPITDNARPTQPQNDRVVNFRPDPTRLDPTPSQPHFPFPDLKNFYLSELKSNNLLSLI
uniref:Carbonic anhydrase n=1 Tax=Daphnia galeata TaxID=27404 RepID=A0A8J2WJR9_9CRUS|nr:unnamed protein product [Daphnia galeata]